MRACYERSGRVVHQNVEIADETLAGQPTGSSSLTQVGPVAVALVFALSAAPLTAFAAFDLKAAPNTVGERV